MHQIKSNSAGFLECHLLLFSLCCTYHSGVGSPWCRVNEKDETRIRHPLGSYQSCSVPNLIQLYGLSTELPSKDEVLHTNIFIVKTINCLYSRENHCILVLSKRNKVHRLYNLLIYIWSFFLNLWALLIDVGNAITCLKSK